MGFLGKNRNFGVQSIVFDSKMMTRSITWLQRFCAQKKPPLIVWWFLRVQTKQKADWRLKSILGGLFRSDKLFILHRYLYREKIIFDKNVGLGARRDLARPYDF